jgi:predicted nucleotidyltransferase component of viral defense system
MMPLQARLKREAHRKIAYAQDLIVKEVYAVLNRAVLHGGTAIWRCYNGKRFSEDLDFYLPKDRHKIDLIFENLKRAGFEIKKKKFTGNGLYSALELDRTIVRLEATFQKIPAILCDYEMSDGNFISIYSLTAEEFLAEKASAYIKRFKVRDLWDVFFLLRSIENPKKIKEIEKLIKNYRKPADEGDLKVILLEGIVPSASEMIEYIKRRWENRYI